MDSAATTGWVERWLAEDPTIGSARQRSDEVGIVPVTPTAGALLAVLAATAGARAVVELGTGTGVSTMWLLRGLRPDGVLTSVDSEAEHHRLAKLSLTEAEIPSGRVRLIAGRALDVLPRLSDGAYDMVFCDANPAENGDYLTAALRLLRPRGVLVFGGALGGDRVADTSARDPETVALRELARTVRAEPALTSTLVPVGAGLLVATVGP